MPKRQVGSHDGYPARTFNDKASVKSASIAIALLGLLALAGFGAYRTWTELEDVAISTNGWIALGLGALATLVLGAGLMFLVFYSSRNGYDDIDRP